MNDIALDQLPLLDAEIINELRELMEDEFTELLNIFLDDLSRQLDRLQIAVVAGDADAIHSIAHKLKSACGSIGAFRLAELTRRLEWAGRDQALSGAAELLRQTQIVASETAAGVRTQLQ